MAPVGSDETLGQVIDTPPPPAPPAPAAPPEEPKESGMDPFTIASIAIGLGTLLFKQAEELGIIEDSPDWAKYVLAGLNISRQALTIIKDMRENMASYADMTPQQVLEQLWPSELTVLRARAYADLGIPMPEPGDLTLTGGLSPSADLGGALPEPA